jgi:hypothetical protein
MHQQVIDHHRDQLVALEEGIRVALGQEVLAIA